MSLQIVGDRGERTQPTTVQLERRRVYLPLICIFSGFRLELVHGQRDAMEVSKKEVCESCIQRVNKGFQ